MKRESLIPTTGKYKAPKLHRNFDKTIYFTISHLKLLAINWPRIAFMWPDWGSLVCSYLRVHHHPQFNKMCVRVHFHLWAQHSNLRAKDTRTVLHHLQSIPINSLSKVKLQLSHTKWSYRRGTITQTCLFKDAIYLTICCHVGSLCVEKLAITKPATI
jgi:hypothetical protein